MRGERGLSLPGKAGIRAFFGGKPSGGAQRAGKMLVRCVEARCFKTRKPTGENT